jgi:hypothetical protein
MAPNTESVPMRWPAGPLDVARRENEKGIPAETAGVLSSWLDPASLALVQGTPVNCLVVSWASGLAADAAQQQALKPLIDKGKQTGLAFVGLIEGGADKAAALAAAQSAGLSAVTMEGDTPGSAGLPVIPRNHAAHVRSAANSPILGISDGLFPGVPERNLGAAGPTNLGWVDSNGATILIARALAPDKGVWIDFDPAPQAKPTAEQYMLAVADPASYGARWVVSLDDQLRADLIAKKQPAADTWKKVAGTLAFFEQYKQARTYQPAGPLAVVSSFTGTDWDLSKEVLNLLPRIRQPFRAIVRSKALGASFAGLQAIYYPDREAPEPKLREKLMAFAKGGGTLFVPSNWPSPEGTPAPSEPYLLFSVRTLGKGRLAVGKLDEAIAYDTVSDVQVIMSHRNDLLRLYSASSSNFVYQTSAQGKQGVIHLLNYSHRPGSDEPCFFMRDSHKSARLVSPEIASAAEVKLAPQEGGGEEFSVPKLAVYGAIELEK